MYNTAKGWSYKYLSFFTIIYYIRFLEPNQIHLFILVED